MIVEVGPRARPKENAMQSTISTQGKIKTRKIRAPQAPLRWKLLNFLRWGFILGLLGNTAAKALEVAGIVVTVIVQLKG